MRITQNIVNVYLLIITSYTRIATCIVAVGRFNAQGFCARHQNHLISDNLAPGKTFVENYEPRNKILCYNDDRHTYISNKGHDEKSEIESDFHRDMLHAKLLDNDKNRVRVNKACKVECSSIDKMSKLLKSGETKLMGNDIKSERIVHKQSDINYHIALEDSSQSDECGCLYKSKITLADEPAKTENDKFICTRESITGVRETRLFDKMAGTKKLHDKVASQGEDVCGMIDGSFCSAIDDNRPEIHIRKERRYIADNIDRVNRYANCSNREARKYEVDDTKVVGDDLSNNYEDIEDNGKNGFDEIGDDKWGGAKEVEECKHSTKLVVQKTLNGGMSEIENTMHNNTSCVENYTAEDTYENNGDVFDIMPGIENEHKLQQIIGLLPAQEEVFTEEDKSILSNAPLHRELNKNVSLNSHSNVTKGDERSNARETTFVLPNTDSDAQSSSMNPLTKKTIPRGINKGLRCDCSYTNPIEIDSQYLEVRQNQSHICGHNTENMSSGQKRLDACPSLTKSNIQNSDRKSIVNKKAKSRLQTSRAPSIDYDQRYTNECAMLTHFYDKSKYGKNIIQRLYDAFCVLTNQIHCKQRKKIQNKALRPHLPLKNKHIFVYNAIVWVLRKCGFAKLEMLTNKGFKILKDPIDDAIRALKLPDRVSHSKFVYCNLTIVFCKYFIENINVTRIKVSKNVSNIQQYCEKLVICFLNVFAPSLYQSTHTKNTPNTELFNIISFNSVTLQISKMDTLPSFLTENSRAVQALNFIVQKEAKTYNAEVLENFLASIIFCRPICVIMCELYNQRCLILRSFETNYDPLILEDAILVINRLINNLQIYVLIIMNTFITNNVFDTCSFGQYCIEQGTIVDAHMLKPVVQNNLMKTLARGFKKHNTPIFDGKAAQIVVDFFKLYTLNLSAEEINTPLKKNKILAHYLYNICLSNYRINLKNNK